MLIAMMFACDLGWIIAKFLNYAVPNCIDERALNKASPSTCSAPIQARLTGCSSILTLHSLYSIGNPDGLSKAELMENITLCIESGRGIGVQVRSRTCCLLLFCSVR